MATDITCQLRGAMLLPVSDEDKDELCKEYAQNQLIRVKTTRVSDSIAPSVRQNNLLHACFAIVADNSEKFNTKEKAKFACKVDLDYRYEDVAAIRKDGTVVFEYRSFSFEELKNMERLKIFERGFQWCADILGITVEKVIQEAKSKMKRY